MNKTTQPHDTMPSFVHPAWESWLLPIVAFLLFGAPKLRLVAGGVPVYAVDVCIGILVVRILMRPAAVFPSVLRPFIQLAAIFSALMFFSELRGAVAYTLPATWVYMAARFLLAASLVYVLPVKVNDMEGLSRILKGAVLGMLFSAAIVILYSFSATRPIVLKTVFSWTFICPDSSDIISKIDGFYSLDATIRGRSLIGAATFTSGVLAAGWPLVFVLMNLETALDFAWTRLLKIAGVLIPVGVLATYGRTAWLSVVLVTAGMLFLRVRGTVKVLVLGLIALAVTMTAAPVVRDQLMVDRVVHRSQETLNAPLKDKGDWERFYSYVQPFYHVAESPIWILLGAGRSSERLGRRGDATQGKQLYDEGKQATHSAFAISYYSFGLIAAFCNVALLASMFTFLGRCIRIAPPLGGQVWRAFLLCWLGFLPWWMFGHGSVGEPRGSMVFFIIYGLVLAYARIRHGSLVNGHQSMVGAVD